MTILYKFVLWATLLLLLTTACQRGPTGAGVTLTDEPTAGLVTLESTGTGPNLPAIERDAVKNALQALLTTGLPSARTTALRTPLAGGQALPAGFLDGFTNGGQYTAFVNSVSRVSSWRRRAAGGGLAVRYAMTINHEALRRELEQRGVIRKFGY